MISASDNKDLVLLWAVVFMQKLIKTCYLIAGFLVFTTLSTAMADEVKILAVDIKSSGKNQWSISVTLKHADTGWSHYADNWRVVDSKGEILGDRVLHHPHVNEQPFTRSLNNVKIPENTNIVYIEAHDKVHNWTPGRMKIDLSNAVNGRLKIEAK